MGEGGSRSPSLFTPLCLQSLHLIGVFSNFAVFVARLCCTSHRFTKRNLEIARPCQPASSVLYVWQSQRRIPRQGQKRGNETVPLLEQFTDDSGNSESLYFVVGTCRRSQQGLSAEPLQSTHPEQYCYDSPWTKSAPRKSLRPGADGIVSIQSQMHPKIYILNLGMLLLFLNVNDGETILSRT